MDRFARWLLAAAVVPAVLLLSAGTASAAPIVAAKPAQTDYLTVFAPGYFQTAEADELVRFSWFGHRSQDFFRVVFNQYRSFGWEASRYESATTRLSSQFIMPSELGLTPGTWYWQVCWGYDPDSTCYLDEEIRRLDIEEPLFLGGDEAKTAVRSILRRRYRARGYIGLRCVRASDEIVVCRGSWRKKGKRVTRRIRLRETATNYVFAVAR